VRVAILGPPNAGKSSLLNALAQREAAIVSPVAGTTRDVVKVTLQLGGLPVELSDTAGLREHTDDPIERLGMQRTEEEAARAHVQVWVCDASDVPQSLQMLQGGRVEFADASLGEETGRLAEERPLLQLLVHNKVDTMATDVPRVPCNGLPASQQWWLSCKTQAGMNEFLSELGAIVGARYGSSDGEFALITRVRHREHVSAAMEAMDAFERLAAQGEDAPLDLAAEELRIAANELGRISGRVDVEELLDVIFRDFCIGK